MWAKLQCGSLKQPCSKAFGQKLCSLNNSVKLVTGQSPRIQACTTSAGSFFHCVFFSYIGAPINVYAWVHLSVIKSFRTPSNSSFLDDLKFDRKIVSMARICHTRCHTRHRINPWHLEEETLEHSWTGSSP